MCSFGRSQQRQEHDLGIMSTAAADTEIESEERAIERGERKRESKERKVERERMRRKVSRDERVVNRQLNAQHSECH